MSTDALSATGVMIGEIVRVYWPLMLGIAVLVIASAGVCSLIFSAQSVHRDEDNVVNFERYPPRGETLMAKAAVTGHTSVMAQRAPKEVASDDAKRRLWRQLDFYPTPPWAARAGAELIHAIDPDAKTLWEPACGQGHMAEALGETFDVTVSDVFDYGYGAVIDFLDPSATLDQEHDWIASNPPFSKGGQFVKLALDRAVRGVAMLCRLAFIESFQRYALMQKLTVLAPFSERVPMQLGSWNPALASATAYAWFIWDKCNLGARQIRMVGPGTKARLWREGDVPRFGTDRERLPLEAFNAS